jgi:hypothetical protein
MTTKILRELSKELTLKQLWKDGIWLQEQVATKRLNPITIDYLNIHKKLLEETYPGKWDFAIELTKKSYQGNPVLNSYGNLEKYEIDIDRLSIQFHPVIHFDNLIISNSKKQSIPIKSIFVKIPYDVELSGKYRLSRIKGTRNVVSYNEYNNSYLHSHLPQPHVYQRTNDRFDSCTFGVYELDYLPFCTGDGEINFMVSKINQEFNENMFKMILLHLEGYLTWESLEGGPHMKIEGLFLKSKADDLHYFNDDNLKEYSKKIIHNQLATPIHQRKTLNWKFENKQYLIKDDEKLEDYCRFRLRKEQYETTVITNKDEEGNYYPLNATIESVQINTEAFIPFQGQKHKMQVEGLLDTSDRPFYIHPQIKQYVKRQLEFIANKEAIRNSATKRA